MSEDPRDVEPTTRDRVAEIIWRQQSAYIPLIDGTHYKAADEIIALLSQPAADHYHQYESRPKFGEPHMVCVTCGGDLYDPRFNPL